MKKEAIIYGLVDCSGTVRYVGKTVNLNTRFRTHQRTRSWCVGVAVLEVVPEGESWVEAERRQITYWGQWGDLENRNRGGNGPPAGVPKSAETRAKMSLAQRGNTKALGYRQTPEHRGKIASARRGTRHSPETRAKISNSLKKRKATP